MAIKAGLLKKAVFAKILELSVQTVKLAALELLVVLAELMVYIFSRSQRVFRLLRAVPIRL